MSRSNPFGFGPGEIHVWTVCLDQPAAVVQELAQVLSSDERRRADRCLIDRTRARFTVCRGILRRALGAYLDQAPEAIAFEYGRHGKPSVRAGGGRRLEFSVSHTRGVGALAFSPLGALGVDVEELERPVDVEALANRFFTPDETEDLLALPAGDRRQGFMNCWTRKEAYLKAGGDGLSRSLRGFSVTLRPADPAAVRWIEGDSGRCWSIGAFTPMPGYVGAVASRRPTATVTVRAWGDAGAPFGGHLVVGT